MASASPTTLTILYGFSVLFICCLLLGGEAATKIGASQRVLDRLATTAFVPSILATLVLAPLLLYAHVGRGGGGTGAGGAAGGGGRRRLLTGLSKATAIAATVALLACAALLVLGADADGAVVQIGADGHLDRGRGDVARLNIK